MLERRLATQLSVIEERLSNLGTRESITSDPPRDPDEDGNEPEDSADLEEMRDAQTAAEKEVGKADEKSEAWTVSSYLTALLGVVAIGGSALVLIEWLARKVQKKPTDDLPPLDETTKEALEDLARQWSRMSDHDYWIKLADYAAKTDSLTLGDQLVFMNITKKIGGRSGGFLWDSAQDEADMVTDLVAAYHRAADSAAAMYRKAAEVTYQGSPVPRVVMADVLSLAFAWLGVKARKEASAS